MKKQTDTFRRLQSVMKDINGDNRQIIKTMQDQIEYLMEFIDIQGEILEDIMRDTRGLSFFAPKIKSGLPLDKNGFMLIQEQRSRVVRFKKQEDKP